MLRIGQLIQSVDAASGGTSTAFLSLLDAVRTQSEHATFHAYTVTPPDADPARPIIKGDGSNRWTLSDAPGRFLGPGQLGRAVISDIDQGKLDLLHIHGLWLPDLVAAARAAARRGIPCVWQPHGMLVRSALAQKRMKKQVFLRLGLARALRRADALVFATAGERDASDLNIPGPRPLAEVVPLPVDVPVGEEQLPTLRAAGRERFGIPADAPLLAFVGRLHPVKRLELTLRALALVRRTLPDARLLVLGSGEPAYEASLKALIGELGLADAAVFAGWAAPDVKWQGLAAADALVLNSMFENFGYVAVEALGARTPVIATENLALAAEIGAAGAGLTPAPTPEAISAATLDLLADPGRTEMGRRGRAWVRNTFSAAAVGRQLTDLYTRLLARRES